MKNIDYIQILFLLNMELKLKYFKGDFKLFYL